MSDARWKLAMKAELGNVWHADRAYTPGIAMCHRSILLFDAPVCTDPGTSDNPGYVCSRCRIISKMTRTRKTDAEVKPGKAAT